MNFSKEELFPVLNYFNPWWQDLPINNLPEWRRVAFRQLYSWITEPISNRAIFLSGARQIGKTTLILQVIEELLQQGVAPANIIYLTFDHPIIKLMGIDAVLKIWREIMPKKPGVEYLFLDEAQLIPHWATWIKHQVDFEKGRRIAFTGSATPLITDDQESGVGRWSTIQLTTLSFYEYIKLKKIILPELPAIKSLTELFSWKDTEFHKLSSQLAPYAANFHEYLERGGFPETAKIEKIELAQRLLREDIVDKVLKRDMTALFGVRNILELEKIFLYLCMHDGGIVNIKTLCENLEIKRATAERFIKLLEAAHLIYQLYPFGYGKEVLRGRNKIYIADAAIATAVLLKRLSTDETRTGSAIETTVFKHLFTRYYSVNVRFSYWQDSKKNEVDFVAEVGDKIIPFEVKYRNTINRTAGLIGLKEFCAQKKIKHAYLISKMSEDFGSFTDDANEKTKIMQIPAALFCYWMGQSELENNKNIPND